MINLLNLKIQAMEKKNSISNNIKNIDTEQNNSKAYKVMNKIGDKDKVIVSDDENKQFLVNILQGYEEYCTDNPIYAKSEESIYNLLQKLLLHNIYFICSGSKDLIVEHFKKAINLLKSPEDLKLVLAKQFENGIDLIKSFEYYVDRSYELQTICLGNIAETINHEMKNDQTNIKQMLFVVAAAHDTVVSRLIDYIRSEIAQENKWAEIYILLVCKIILEHPEKKIYDITDVINHINNTVKEKNMIEDAIIQYNQQSETLENDYKTYQKSEFFN